MKKIATLMVLFSIVVFAQQKGSFTDTRDGKTYKWVKIGTQTWMAENLNYNANGSQCYKNKPDYCHRYGRLYDWETAKIICPKDWHLPSNREWDALITAVGGNSIAGTKLKAKGDWTDDGNGTNDYGFSALPGGFGDSRGSTFLVNDSGNWWSATEKNSSWAYQRGMHYLNTDVLSFDNYKMNIISVRCIQD